MADYLATNEKAGTGAIMTVSIDFKGVDPDVGSGAVPYINVSDVKAEIVTPATQTTGETSVAVGLTNIGPTTFRTDAVVPANKVLRIYRASQDEYGLVQFQALQNVTEKDLDLLARQILYVAMETKDLAARAVAAGQYSDTLARLALTTSNNAILTAGQAVSTANNAVAAATSAVQTANEANSRSNQAIQTANSAVANVQDAVEAANDATAAAQAATEAAAQAVEDAQNAVREGTGRFLQPSTTEPALRDDGAPLETGDRYLNTASGIEFIYQGNSWVANNLDGADIANDSDPSKGAALVGWDGQRLSDLLTKAAVFTSYSELRAYSGTSTRGIINADGIGGEVYVDPSDTTSLDDGGICFIDSLGRRWKRSFSALRGINVLWYQPPVAGTGDALPAFNAAAAAAIRLQNGSASGSTPQVIVEGGTFSLSAPTTGRVQWLLEPTGKLSTPSSVPGMDFSMSRLSGKIYRRSGVNQLTNIMVGDPAMSAHASLVLLGAPNLFPAEVMGMSGVGAGGIMGSSTTSGSQTYDMASIGVIGLHVNDNTQVIKPGYGGYIEAVRAPGTGNETGIEVTSVNYGSVYLDNPYKGRDPKSGETYTVVLTSGGASGSGAQDSTGAVLISGKAEGAYTQGLMFKVGSLKGNKEAISSPVGYNWSWYASATTVDAYLDSSQHTRTNRGSTTTDSVEDLHRRAGPGLTVSPTGADVYRMRTQTHNGTSYYDSSRFVVNQVTAHSNGVARHSLTFGAMGSDGVMALLTINGSQNKEFSPVLDNVWDLGTKQSRWGNARIRQLRPGEGDVVWTSGVGSPEGVIPGPKGSLYTNTGTGPTLWYKASGNGPTGWVALSTS